MCQIKSLFKDLEFFFKNREQIKFFSQNEARIKLWVVSRKTNEDVSSKIEDGVGQVHGQGFATHNGQAYITCECVDQNCKLGDFVDENDLMDLMPTSTFIHIACPHLVDYIKQPLLGTLGEFKVILKK